MSDKAIVKISSSSLYDLQSCARLYKFNKIDRLQPIKKERPLDYGNLFHYMVHPWRFGQIAEPKEHHLKHPYSRLLGMSKGDLNGICREIGRLKILTTDLSGTTDRKH